MSERDELTGALVAARYRLEGLLPGGADSTSVFAAIDTRGNAPVILRLLTVDSLVTVDEFQRHLLSVDRKCHGQGPKRLPCHEGSVQCSGP